MLPPYGHLAPSLFSVHCVRIQCPAEKQGLHSCLCLLESRQSLSPTLPAPFVFHNSEAEAFRTAAL